VDYAPDRSIAWEETAYAAPASRLGISTLTTDALLNVPICDPCDSDDVSTHVRVIGAR